MKSLSILTLSLLLISGFSFAQADVPAVKPIEVDLNYNDVTLKQAIDKGNVTFVFRNIQDGPMLERFTQTIGYYTQYFTVSVGAYQANGERQCAIILQNADGFRFIQRLLLSNGVTKLKYNGQLVPIDTFFSAKRG